LVFTSGVTPVGTSQLGNSEGLEKPVPNILVSKLPIPKLDSPMGRRWLTEFGTYSQSSWGLELELSSSLAGNDPSISRFLAIDLPSGLS